EGGPRHERRGQRGALAHGIAGGGRTTLAPGSVRRGRLGGHARRVPPRPGLPEGPRAARTRRCAARPADRPAPAPGPPGRADSRRHRRGGGPGRQPRPRMRGGRGGGIRRQRRSPPPALAQELRGYPYPVARGIPRGPRRRRGAPV
ncbi:MAG: hypothetical protein AVDCRST_MAG49-1709, partial [uncultured Thermomicrobiales bacterium]